MEDLLAETCRHDPTFSTVVKSNTGQSSNLSIESDICTKCDHDLIQFLNDCRLNDKRFLNYIDFGLCTRSKF